MCGICGTAGFEDEHLLRDMCSMIQHRGPDNGGVFVYAGVGLDHNRVKIGIEIAYGSMCRWTL
ncbi:MAG: hypothetical protein ACT6FC_04985 [Methanosarcinaceae archaeon]